MSGYERREGTGTVWAGATWWSKEEGMEDGRKENWNLGWS